jgi:multidrug resistance efflux pump
MRIGQRADISIDAYGGTPYLGHVQQIVREAASQFSQVPSQDNASGNFTKVSQRVPVLIALDPGTTGNDLLPGLSAEVTIHFYV